MQNLESVAQKMIELCSISYFVPPPPPVTYFPIELCASRQQKNEENSTVKPNLATSTNILITTINYPFSFWIHQKKVAAENLRYDL